MTFHEFSDILAKTEGVSKYSGWHINHINPSYIYCIYNKKISMQVYYADNYYAAVIFRISKNEINSDWNFLELNGIEDKYALETMLTDVLSSDNFGTICAKIYNYNISAELDKLD